MKARVSYTLYKNFKASLNIDFAESKYTGPTVSTTALNAKTKVSATQTADSVTLKRNTTFQAKYCCTNCPKALAIYKFIICIYNIVKKFIANRLKVTSLD